LRRKSRNKPIFWIAVAVVAVVAIGLVGTRLTQGRVRADTTTEAGQVVTTFVGNLSTDVSASGQVRSQNEAKLALTTPGQVQQVLVQVGQRVKAGDILIRLDSDGLERAVQSAQQALAIQEAQLAGLLQEPDQGQVAATEAAVASAQAQLDDLLAGPSQEELAQVQAALASAQAQLDDLLAGPSKEQLAQAKASVESAQAALVAAKARYDALDDQLIGAQNDIHSAQLGKDRARDQYNQLIWNSPDRMVAESWGPYSPQGAAVKMAQIDYDVAVARLHLAQIDVNDSGVLSAQAQVAQAEANLATLTSKNTAQIASARARLAQAQADLASLTKDKTAQIASARAQLAQVEAQRQDLLAGPSDEQLAIARAQVEKARIALEKAQYDLANATLVAPFDGLITQVYPQAGEWASGPAVELVDVNSMEVVLDVDEVDIGAVEVGQPASVTFEPWPDRELQGQVVSISPQAKNNAGIVVYEVHLAVQASDLPMRAGMTANANLVTANLENVLLVPNRAIIADRQAGKYYVYRVQGQETTRVEITIGLRDREYTQIKSGLQEGDKLLIPDASQKLDFTQRPPEFH
jgi:HlyD family secretion protein